MNYKRCLYVHSLQECEQGENCIQLPYVYTMSVHTAPKESVTIIFGLFVTLKQNVLLYEGCPESKDPSHVGRQGIFYAYCGNTAVDLDPLPVSRARLTVVEPASFE